MTSVAVPRGVGVTLDQTVDARLRHLSEQLEQVNAELAEQRRQREVLTELLGELTHVTGPAMTLITDRLGELEERGYLGFARQGAQIVDRVVTSFSEEDVAALGDNVVLILETLREMTQPDVMQMLRQTAHLVNEPPPEAATPPSLMALLRELRDPQVRRGLARVMTMLQAVGETPHDDLGGTDDQTDGRAIDGTTSSAQTQTDQEVE